MKSNPAISKCICENKNAIECKCGAFFNEVKAFAKRTARNKARRERNQAMRDLGLVRVRGSLGGVYWE